MLDKDKKSLHQKRDKQHADVAYHNQRYTLGREDEQPYLIVCGERYTLSCHPYEPCLYIRDKGGSLTAVHNSFDPAVVQECFCADKTVSSITGRRYAPKDFCRMVEYAAGMGDIGIDDAEKVFGKQAEEKKPATEPKGKKAFESSQTIRQEAGGEIWHDRKFEALISRYPGCVIDYCIVKSTKDEQGRNAHRNVLSRACEEICFDGRDAVWYYDISIAEGNEVSADVLFEKKRDDGRLDYHRAFCHPPYEAGYDDKDFDLVNAVLFPNGTDGLEVFEWSTDWSDYFDDGHEWWGSLCLTVYDGNLDRYVVILASATD